MPGAKRGGNKSHATCRAADRVHERVLWLIKLMAEPSRRRFMVAWSAETVDAFVKAFPEAERSLRYYMFGPNSSPMLNRAAQRAKRLGFVVAGHIGNDDARALSQRTWCRTWTLTDRGMEAANRASMSQQAEGVRHA